MGLRSDELHARGARHELEIDAQPVPVPVVLPSVHYCQRRELVRHGNHDDQRNGGRFQGLQGVRELVEQLQLLANFAPGAGAVWISGLLLQGLPASLQAPAPPRSGRDKPLGSGRGEGGGSIEIRPAAGPEDGAEEERAE